MREEVEAALATVDGHLRSNGVDYLCSNSVSVWDIALYARINGVIEPLDYFKGYKVLDADRRSALSEWFSRMRALDHVAYDRVESIRGFMRFYPDDHPKHVDP